jgi:CPA1 family monovalent cation:H+ antiporter
MLISLIFSLLVIAAGNIFPAFRASLEELVLQFDFTELLMGSMLSFMLFAGSIHVHFSDLRAERLSIFVYSTISVLLSTFIVGSAMFYIVQLFGLEVAFIHCLLFGALISPTDPIAVLSILKSAGVSKSLETKIAGESLFNDGVAVVVFITLWQLASSTNSITVKEVVVLFTKEAVGGLLLGIALGWVGFRLISSIDNYQVEVMISIAS